MEHLTNDPRKNLHRPTLSKGTKKFCAEEICPNFLCSLRAKIFMRPKTMGPGQQDIGTSGSASEDRSHRLR